MGNDRVRPLQTRKLSTVEPKAVSWLWKRWIPCNALTLLEGESGCGKSTVLTDIVARATTGTPWPGDDISRDPVTVIWIQSEEGEAEVLVPRLMVAGADRDRVHTLVETDPWKASQADRLCKTVGALRAGLVVIDPLKAYLGGADDNNEIAVRAAIQPLNSIGVPVVGVRHWTKGARRASERGGGSLAYRAVARASIIVAKSIDSDGVIMAPEKSSLGRAPTPWELEIDEGDIVAGDERPVVRWKFERPDITANMLSTHDPAEDGKRGKAAAAEAAIKDYIRANGEQVGYRKVVDHVADAVGCSGRTVQRALKEAPGVEVVKESKFQGAATVKLSPV